MIYFDNAATTFPKPRSVYRAYNECIQKYCGNPGRSSHMLARRAEEEIFRVREEISELFGICSPERVVFTLNATYALNIAIKTTLKEKEVLYSDMEHNSVIRPLMRLAKEGKIKPIIFSAEGDIEENIRSRITRNTGAIVCTLCSNVTGEKIPLSLLSRLREEYGLCVIVDASQLAGHEPIDLSKYPVDILCAPGHKGLFGIQGAGFLIFCDDRRRESFIEGGSGVDSTNEEMPELLPERFEGGTLPTPAIVSLGAGVRYLRSVGLSNVKRRIDELSVALTDRLRSLDGVELYGDARCGICSFNLDGIPSSRLCEYLDEKGICTRGGLHCAPLIHKRLGTERCGSVRVSLSYFNELSEIDKLYRVLGEL